MRILRWRNDEMSWSGSLT